MTAPEDAVRSRSWSLARTAPCPRRSRPAATRASRALFDDAYAAACATLIDNMTVLRRISAYLVEHERVDGDTFDALFDGSQAVHNGEDEWRPDTSRLRAWGEIAAFLDRRRPILVVSADEPAPQLIPVLPWMYPFPRRQRRN